MASEAPPSSQAADIAAGLADDFGEGALAAAKVALWHSTERGMGGTVELWTEVCAILAVQD